MKTRKVQIRVSAKAHELLTKIKEMEGVSKEFALEQALKDKYGEDLEYKKIR